MDYFIEIKRQTLTDGSHVFDVVLEDRFCNGVRFNAISETEANSFAFQLGSLIDSYTCNGVTLRESAFAE